MSNIFESALTNKHIVIIGGSSGMGKAIAKLALSFGANVTIASRNTAKLEMAATELNHSQLSTMEVDTMDEQNVKHWAASLTPVDHLIISASSAAHGSFTDLPTDAFRQMLESKLIGPYVAAREVLPFMNEQASIIFFQVY